MAAKVTAEDRAKTHGPCGEGRFPVQTKQQAISAVRLRGKAGSTECRNSILRRAAKFVPEMVRKARAADQKAGKS